MVLVVFCLIDINTLVLKRVYLISGDLHKILNGIVFEFLTVRNNNL